jgi:hypothetical protein
MTTNLNPWLGAAPADVIYRLIRRGLTEFAARAGVTDLGDDDRLVDAPMARWSPNI